MAWPEDLQDSRCVWLEPSLGQWEGGKGRHFSGGQCQSWCAPPHAAPPLPQVVAIDLDEGLNGLVSYRMQVGMPRMDFLINSSSGVVVTTTELDRERIAEYQLRVVATDAGTPTKSSTSTLTIRGEKGEGLDTWAWAVGQYRMGWGAPTYPCSPLSNGVPSSTGTIRHSTAFLSLPSQNCQRALSPPGHCLWGPRAQGQWPGPTAKGAFSDSSCRREGLSRGGPSGSETVWEVAEPSSPLKARDFIWGCKGNFPSQVPGRLHPGRRAAGVPRLLQGMRASPRPSP